MMREILIGTNNQDKLKQFRLFFKQLNLDIKAHSLADLGIEDEVEEDLNSILEIAKKKAKCYAEKSGVITLSDDLGLFVDALGGEPGIHAKRWHEGTENDRCFKLQERLKDISEKQRTAIYDPEKKEFWTYEGSIEGVISDEFKGSLGFGYDPIFKLPDGRHFAELSEEERNTISHRGKTIRKYLNRT